ncbi:MAG: sialidase family protein [Gemmatimonadota bacterium]
MNLRPPRAVFCALAMLLASTACRETEVTLDSPVLAADEAPAAGPGANTPHLTAAAGGSIWMSWLEPGPDSVWMLRVAHRQPAGTWSPPRTAVRDSLLFVNWADFPSLAVDAKGRLIAHYLRRSSAGKYSYGAWITTSADSGLSWSAPQRLHSDSSATEHGFAALVPQPDGSTFAAWLDGHAAFGEHGEMSLGFGVIDSTMRVRSDTMLDLRTCDCCQVAGASTSGGALFAYRDRTDKEVRDIAVVRYEDGRWTPPAIVHDDGWVTRACPVNGPALSARDRGVALAWFTNAQDSAKVQLVFSKDRGATWSAPIRIDDGQPIGRVDVEYLLDDGALVTWVERTGKGTAEIRARRVGADGALSKATIVEKTTDARPMGFPRITAARDLGVYVTWRELSTPSRLRMALLKVPGG